MTPIRTTSMLTALTITTAMPLPAAAQAECAQWDVRGGWEAVQSNGIRALFELHQTGTKLNGEGVVGAIVNNRGSITRSPVQGTLIGNAIEYTVGWGGVYSGRIDATGRIDGTTYDKKDSTSSARWYSHRRMECLARRQATPAAKPVKKLGKKPSTVPVSQSISSGSIHKQRDILVK